MLGEVRCGGMMMMMVNDTKWGAAASDSTSFRIIARFIFFLKNHYIRDGCGAEWYKKHERVKWDLSYALFNLTGSMIRVSYIVTNIK